MKNREKGNSSPAWLASAPKNARLLKAGFGFFQADIWLVEPKRNPRIWKSWAGRPFLERLLVDRHLALREGKILDSLSDLTGVPAFLGHPSKDVLEMTYLDGDVIPDYHVIPKNNLYEPYFRNLEKMIQSLHKRGITHGDLRRKNLLSHPENNHQPFLIDFTQSLCFPQPRSWLSEKIYQKACQIDWLTYLKLKKRYLGAKSLSLDEIKELNRLPWLLRTGRLLRKKIYRPIRRKLRYPVLNRKKQIINHVKNQE